VKPPRQLNTFGDNRAYGFLSYLLRVKFNEMLKQIRQPDITGKIDEEAKKGKRLISWKITCQEGQVRDRSYLGSSEQFG
jgi:hypothetical protein